MTTQRSTTEAVYELEVIRPAQEGGSIDLARIPSLVPSAKDSKVYLERASEPEEGTTNVSQVEEPAPDGGRDAWTAVFACYVVTSVMIPCLSFNPDETDLPLLHITLSDSSTSERPTPSE
jgi:hypothetical protein